MKTLARFFLFLAAAQLALGQPMIPVSNLSPVGANSLVGNIGASGRGESIPLGAGLSFVGGALVAGAGGGAAPADATYITQTPNGTLTAEQALSLLNTGIMFVTTGTGAITSLTMSGDATFASNGALTLASTAVTPGTYGSATAVPTIIVDAKGRITSASNTTITATGNVTAAGTLDSGNIVIGQGAKAIATSSVFSISGSNATVTGNLSITGSTTFNNLTTSNLTVTGNIVGNLSATQVTIADAGGYYTGTEVESALQEVGGNIVALQSVIGPTPSGNQLISGGGVALAPGGGLDITVSAASYLIQGTNYTSALTNLTLSAADPSNPRIDVVAVNSSGNAVIIEGTAAATPAKPDVDPATQLELTFFLVGAGATELDVDVVDVYLNNAEWTTSTNSAGTINVASTNNPYTGALCIEGTTVTTGNYVRFVKPASGTFDMADSDNLVFYIRSKAAWANNRIMSITVRDASSVQLGSSVTFDQGLFGFNSGQTTTYQQIIIPTALFAANGLTASQIQITLGGSGGTVGFYIDDVTLQGGVASITDASRMKWRGNYLASNFYNVNDVVLSSGIQYVAIQAGVGNTPVSSPTFWQASSTSTGGTVTVSGTPTSGQLAEWTSATNVQGKTLGTGVSTFLTTPTFTNLSSAVTGATIFANTTQSNALQAAQQVTLSSSGTDSFVGTAGVTSTAYIAGRSYSFVANNANTGAASLDVDGLGATTIVKVSGGITTTLADNDIRSGQVVTVAYDGTNFQLQSTLGNAASGGSPAGSSGYVQFNNAGSFGANAGFGFDNSNVILNVGDSAIAPVFPSNTKLQLIGSATDAILEISGTSGAAGAGIADIHFINRGVGSGTSSLAYIQVQSGGSANIGRLNFATKRSAGDSASTFAFMVDETGKINFGSTAAGSTFYSASGNLEFNSTTSYYKLANGTANFLNFGAVGLNGPAFTTRSAGTKVILYDAISGGSADFAIGVETAGGGTSYQWYSAGSPTLSGHRWYSGTTKTAELSPAGVLSTDIIGGTFAVKSGSNAKAGTVTLSSGAGTISSTAITANSVLCISLKTASGVITEHPYATAVTAGTSYTIAAGAGDNSTYNWIILEVN